MNDFQTLVHTRRSIRRYTDQDVPEPILADIFEAVRWSPSWANTQCWDIVAVRDAEVKAALQETIFPKNPATKAITAAPVVLAITGKIESSGFYKGLVTTEHGDWMLYDLGIATQSLCLAAHAHGLGTVVVGLFDHAAANRILNVPASHRTVSLIPLGYPAKIGKAPERKPIDQFVHWDRF